MIVDRVRAIETDDVARFAWAGLARFHNVEYTARAIDQLHSLRGKQSGNVKKQALQIRYCLIQAYEYRKAAQVVGLSTKPLLYYYSAMSLALAEVLMKGSGDYSLDRARGKNAHHGLTFKGGEAAKSGVAFGAAAEGLVAVPLEQSTGLRFGTFELWHTHARELPNCGKVVRTLERGRSETLEVVASPEDTRMSLVPSTGISLLDCYQCLPQMRDFLHQHGVPSFTVKSNVSMKMDTIKKTVEFTMILQPAKAEALEAVYDKILFRAYRESSVDVHDYGDGCAIKVRSTEDDSEEMRVPSSCQINSDGIFFYSKLESLNEFGLFYVALYILGNYARYYPDKWMSDVENYSTMALAADELLVHAEARLPLLALSELDRCVFVGS